MQQRIYFSVNNSALSLIESNTTDKFSFPSIIMSLSEEGMSVLIDKTRKSELAANEPVDIKSIIFPRDSEELRNLKGEIEYIIEDENIDVVSVRFKFKEISRENMKIIRDYIEKTFDDFEVIKPGM